MLTYIPNNIGTLDCSLMCLQQFGSFIELRASLHRIMRVCLPCTFYNVVFTV